MSTGLFLVFQRYASKIAVIGFLLFTSLFYFQQLNFNTSDLGRHITNGRVILETKQVLSTNYYSYTHPDFPSVNHHWLFGVLVYLIHQLAGFIGITVFAAVLGVTTMALCLDLARRKTNWKYAVLAGVVLLPLITTRIEPRPELVSLLGVSLFIWLLDRYASKHISFTQLTTAIVGFQILWVNTHLFFIFGPFVVGAWWLETFFTHWLSERRQSLVRASVLLAVVSAACCIHPAGIWGALQPLRIFENYGYEILENQSLWFVIQRLGQPVYWYGLLLVGLSTLLQIGTTKYKNWKGEISVVVYLVTFGVMTLMINRALPFFGVIVLPIFAVHLKRFFDRYYQQLHVVLRSDVGAAVLGVLGFGGVALAGLSGMWWPLGSRFGLGLLPSSSASADFFKDHSIQGLIFNNYDIGGYLIYHLYPDQKVFVDNRPESYPADFFSDEYIAAQEDEERWQQLLEQHDFNAIYFYRHDLTPWAQPFLIKRLHDPLWVPVFVDAYSIIFVKDAQQNQQLIKEFELPSELFGETRVE